MDTIERERLNTIKGIIQHHPRSKTGKLLIEYQKYSKDIISLRQFQAKLELMRKNKEILCKKGLWYINYEFELSRFEAEQGFKFSPKLRRINLAIMNMELWGEEGEKKSWELFGDETPVTVETSQGVKTFDNREKADKYLRSLEKKGKI